MTDSESNTTAERERFSALGGDNTPPTGRRWSLARRRRFNASMRRKKWLAHEATRNSTGQSENPREEDLPHVGWCPKCGMNMRNIALAMAFGEKQRSAPVAD
jgi:hypothetical protein